MCRISSTLKLCTCDVGDVSQLQNYWILHRFHSGKDYFVIGRTMVPDVLDPQDEAFNRALLLARLQEPDAFDVDLEPQEGDRLQLTFQVSGRDGAGQQPPKMITYGYAWSGGRWVEERFDHHMWQWQHDRERFGELRPGMTASGVT